MTEIANGEIKKMDLFKMRATNFQRYFWSTYEMRSSKGQTSPKLLGLFSGSLIENVLLNLYSIVACIRIIGIQVELLINFDYQTSATYDLAIINNLEF